MSAASKAAKSKLDYRIHGGPWASAWKICAGLAVVGLGGSLAGYGSDPQRFAFSYLFGFAVALTMFFGAMFFVLVQRLTAAHWSVTVRRIAELMLGGAPALAVLFIPVALSMGHLFPWLGNHHGGGHGADHGAAHAGPSSAGGHGEGHGAAPAPSHGEGHGAPAANADGHGAGHGAAGHGQSYSELFSDTSLTHIEHEDHARIIGSKRPYLNTTFFWIRVALYFTAWILLGARFLGLSTKQDETKDPELTNKAAAMAPGSTAVFALTLTFASFDWFMSLEPSWYSTIFGVQIFAGSAMFIMAVLILVSLGLKKAGVVDDAISTEHYHDLGKLLFGFTAFWAYISFSQFFLIWYASIPEETTFYHHRWSEGPWTAVSVLLIFGHFVFPFWLLISRNVKRRIPMLAFGAAWQVLMHVVEMYWLVLPNYAVARGIDAARPEALSLHWLDLTCLIGCVSAFLALVFFRMTKHPVVPVGDPRFARSFKFENF